MTLYATWLKLSLPILVGGLPLHALSKTVSPDSLLPVSIRHIQRESVFPDLVDIETEYTQTNDDRKALVRLLKIAKLKRAIRDETVRTRLLADLADVSARLKLYPLAMKCYAKAAYLNWNGETTLIDSNLYQRFVALDSAQPDAYGSHEVKSYPVDGPEIWSPFEDGKTASSYALLLHVKQPQPGKRKSYTGINNVGHTFITLIKYNTDNTYVSRSFGFYPNKRGFLSATPLHPGAPSVFKNDSLHEWDEAVGRFISYRKFQRIVRIIKRYNLREYDLNQNNCTNFGLNVAMIAGISIRETRGRWPLGNGSNPANAGQSILEGKIDNTGDDSPEPLFIGRSSVLAGSYP
jgi:hypothetical protein